MKRICIIILLLLINVCGCSSKSKNSFSETDNEDSIKKYGINQMSAYCISEDQIFYTRIDDTKLYCMDNEGALIKSYTAGEGYLCNLAYDNGFVYYVSLADKGISFNKIDIKTGDRITAPVDGAVNGFLNLAVVGDNIIYIYMNNEYDAIEASIRYDENDDYYYLGQKAAVFNWQTEDTEQLDISNVISFCKDNDGQLLFYAYDDIGGYYFTRYLEKEKTFGEKLYDNNIGYTFSFDYNDGKKEVIYSGGLEQSIKVSIQDTDEISELLPEALAASGNDIQYENGYTYVLNAKDSNLYRVNNHQVLKDNKGIVVYLPHFILDNPLGCGYKMKIKTITDEEFALAILAGDSNYDLCMMESGETFSRSIRDKSAYYPLNDVPGVKEYLNQCFPYIEQAATADNGEIWMLPIALNASAILYNEQNCIDEGIDIAGANTHLELASIAKQLYEKGDNRDKYSLNGYQLAGNMQDQYNTFYAIQNNKANFDTPLFRKVMITINEEINQEDEALHTNLYSPSSIARNLYYQSYLFELSIYRYNVLSEDGYNCLRARGLPDIDAGKKNPNVIDCTFICINPNSENLESTLNYISDLCNAMLEQTDNYKFKDIGLYSHRDSNLVKDLYGIYENGAISFNLSYEMFWEDYLKYLNKEMTLEEFIIEIQRKTNAYLNE